MKMISRIILLLSSLAYCCRSGVAQQYWKEALDPDIAARTAMVVMIASSLADQRPIALRSRQL